MSDKRSLFSVQDSNHPSILNSQFSFSVFDELIKRKQTFLLVYTTIFAFLIASWTMSEIVLSKLVWVSIGLFFAVSGSTLLNMVIDSDIDALMERTKSRPIPSGRIASSTVLKYGLLFTIIGLTIVGFFLNFITLIVVLAGVILDVVVYSIYLKRRTKYSIIFGGIAGGLPAIAGRTSVIGTIDLISIFLALFILCWIPLHILTLALSPINLEGYTKASIPMWPVISGASSTMRVISISAIFSALAIVATGYFLGIYILLFLPLLIFSFYLILLSILNLNWPTTQRTYKLFKLASLYMFLSFFWLFLGVVVSTYSTCPLRIVL
jgi:protoheme IX farnesyltransferase